VNSDKVISENNEGKKCPLADPFSTPVQELALHGSQHGAVGKKGIVHHLLFLSI
jgi:hypothetical protein